MALTMTSICLKTKIRAPREVVFDLSRSIDLHMRSTAHTRETAIAGRTSGLIGPKETVTWRARHFGYFFTMTSGITDYCFPTHFRDEMVRGPFRRIRHDHYFDNDETGTVMRDVFEFEAPLGLVGKLTSMLLLRGHLRRLLRRRNKMIREYAESGRWKELIRG